MYYATSTTHMKHIVKLDKGKYIQLDSYGQRPAHPLEPFIVGFFVAAIAAITAGAMFGGDITKNIPPHIPFIKTVAGY